MRYSTRKTMLKNLDTEKPSGESVTLTFYNTILLIVICYQTNYLCLGCTCGPSARTGSGSSPSPSACTRPSPSARTSSILVPEPAIGNYNDLFMYLAVSLFRLLKFIRFKILGPTRIFFMIKQPGVFEVRGNRQHKSNFRNLGITTLVKSDCVPKTIAFDDNYYLRRVNSSDLASYPGLFMITCKTG